MIVAHFKKDDGTEQVIRMPQVKASEIQSVCNALKHDLKASHYEYYIPK